MECDSRCLRPEPPWNSSVRRDQVACGWIQFLTEVLPWQDAESFSIENMTQNVR